MPSPHCRKNHRKTLTGPKRRRLENPPQDISDDMPPPSSERNPHPYRTKPAATDSPRLSHLPPRSPEPSIRLPRGSRTCAARTASDRRDLHSAQQPQPSHRPADSDLARENSHAPPS